MTPTGYHGSEQNYRFVRKDHGGSLPQVSKRGNTCSEAFIPAGPVCTTNKRDLTLSPTTWRMRPRSGSKKRALQVRALKTIWRARSATSRRTGSSAGSVILPRALRSVKCIPTTRRVLCVKRPTPTTSRWTATDSLPSGSPTAKAGIISVIRAPEVST